MSKDLHSRIEERKKEALSKNLPYKIKLVGQIFGEAKKVFWQDSGESFEIGESYKIKKKGFCFEFYDYYFSDSNKGDWMRVFGGKNMENTLFEVFVPPESINLKFKGYIPGSWEVVLDSLYKEAVIKSKEIEDKENRRKIEVKEHEEERLRKSYGL
jgi:hypothetical protein